MSDEQTPSQEQVTSEPSLEQVYKTYNVEAEAQTFQPQRQEPQRNETATVQQTGSVPDPVLDPVGYKSWLSQQTSFTQQALSQIHGKLTQFERERHVEREAADIKTAVQTFKQVAGDVDDDFAEVALGQKARKDPKFMAIYQNRGRNPQAWNAAVKAYGNEFKAKNTFKVDPQIAENQRAAKLSTQGSQAKQQTEQLSPIEAKFQGKTGRDFDAEWRRLVDSGM